MNIRTKPFPNWKNASGQSFGQEEIELLTQVINSGILNRNNGTVVKEFEKEFAALYGVKHAIASTSGTAALHIAMGALELNPGDEVITTPITDMGTIIAILLCNAVPVFADVDPDTGCLDPLAIEKVVSEKTKAVVPVHLFGNPCDLDSILKIADKFGLSVVEDCAQAHLAEYRGKKIGTVGNMGCFSFQQAKQISCGDGGMTITNDDELAAKARLFSDKGWPRDTSGRGHISLGPNYRMTELQGAVALAQTRKVEAIVASVRHSALLLKEKLDALDGIKVTPSYAGAASSWWRFSFQIDTDVINATPTEFNEVLSPQNIPNGLGYIGMPIFGYDMLKFRKTYGTSQCPYTCANARQDITYDIKDLPGAQKILTNLFTVVWNSKYTDEDVEDIYNTIKITVDHFAK